MIKLVPLVKTGHQQIFKEVSEQKISSKALAWTNAMKCQVVPGGEIQTESHANFYRCFIFKTTDLSELSILPNTG